MSKHDEKGTLEYMYYLKEMLPISLITVVVFILSKIPSTRVYLLHFALIFLVFLIVVALKKRHTRMPTLFMYVSVTFVLLFVASTGWFLSPFFFSLYFIAIALAFMFSLTASLAFIGCLVVLFSFNIGDVDVAYDFLVIVSLLSVIPLVIYLRRSYLQLKENEKQILILTKEKKDYINKVDEILSNTVNNLSADLRQPINDAKQIAYYLVEHKKDEKQDEYLHRIITSSDEALAILKEFESKSTGNVLMTNPKKK